MQKQILCDLENILHKEKSENYGRYLDSIPFTLILLKIKLMIKEISWIVVHILITAEDIRGYTSKQSTIKTTLVWLHFDLSIWSKKAEGAWFSEKHQNGPKLEELQICRVRREENVDRTIISSKNRQDWQG